MKARFLIPALILAATAAWAGPFDGLRRTPTEQVRHEIAILNLVNGLDLTADQRRALLGQAEKARELRGQCRNQEQALEAEAHSSFVALRAELLKGQPADPAVERRAQEANRSLDLAHEQCTLPMHALTEETRDLLTPGQLDIVEHYAPCLVPPKNLRDPSRVGQANDGSAIEQALERVRSMPPARRQVGEQVFVNRHLERYGRIKPMASPAELDAEKARVDGVLVRAFAMSDADFALNRARLGDEIARPFAPRQERTPLARVVSNIQRFLLDDATPDLLRSVNKANAR
jgi:hypothetical protein